MTCDARNAAAATRGFVALPARFVPPGCADVLFSSYANLFGMTIAHGYRALADPSRREILRLLREGDLPAGELASHFDISWPSVSRHLRVLEEAGLVESRRSGGNIIYALRTSVLHDIVTELADLTGVGQPDPETPAVQATRRPQRA
jgi:ArsR family transcriptional regulator, arsenate/arsenite/antimonite-responsive transcriptional repressor